MNQSTVANVQIYWTLSKKKKKKNPTVSHETVGALGDWYSNVLLKGTHYFSSLNVEGWWFPFNYRLASLTSLSFLIYQIRSFQDSKLSAHKKKAI